MAKSAAPFEVLVLLPLLTLPLPPFTPFPQSITHSIIRSPLWTWVISWGPKDVLLF